MDNGITRFVAAYITQPRGKMGVIFALLAEVFTKLFGGWDVLLETLIICMIFDYISGLAVAFKGKSNKSVSGKLSSKAGWNGLIKKGVTLMVVLFACRLDLVSAQLGVDLFVNVRVVVIGFFIGIEGLSLLENYKALGGKLPNILVNALEDITEKAGGVNENITDGTEFDKEL